MEDPILAVFAGRSSLVTVSSDAFLCPSGSRLCISSGLRREADHFTSCCHDPSQRPVSLCRSFPCGRGVFRLVCHCMVAAWALLNVSVTRLGSSWLQLSFPKVCCRLCKQRIPAPPSMISQLFCGYSNL